MTANKQTSDCRRSGAEDDMVSGESADIQPREIVICRFFTPLKTSGRTSERMSMTVLAQISIPSPGTVQGCGQQACLSCCPPPMASVSIVAVAQIYAVNVTGRVGPFFVPGQRHARSSKHTGTTCVQRRLPHTWCRGGRNETNSNHCVHATTTSGPKERQTLNLPMRGYTTIRWPFPR